MAVKTIKKVEIRFMKHNAGEYSIKTKPYSLIPGDDLIIKFRVKEKGFVLDEIVVETTEKLTGES